MNRTGPKVLILMFASLITGAIPLQGQLNYMPYAFTNVAGAQMNGSDDGDLTTARFGSNYGGPTGVALDTKSNIYVADYGNHTIRKISASGIVTTFAGSAGQIGTNDGPGIAARFNYPVAIAVDHSDNLYVADYRNHSIRKITPDAMVTTFAGISGIDGKSDGIAGAALFQNPSGLAIDRSNNVYVADTGNYTIRLIGQDRFVTTIAGIAGIPGSVDGPRESAIFGGSIGIGLDGMENIFVADTGNNTIRKISPQGFVTTLAGSPGIVGSADGSGADAQFWEPVGVAVDSQGNVFVSDNWNSTIRRVSPGGVVTTIGGVPLQNYFCDGAGPEARFFYPFGLALDPDGNLYVADAYNNRITKGIPVLQFDIAALNFEKTNKKFTMRLIGPSHCAIALESSTNGSSWAAIQTNTISRGYLDIFANPSQNQHEIFRAKLL